jgi:serine/threonine-protein kinase HipA
VRFAPLYDAVTTRVFPELSGDRMAFKLAGKDDRLVRRDFLTLARTIDLAVGRAEALITEMTLALRKSAARLQLPSVANRRARKEASSMLKRIVEIVQARAETMG